MSIHDEERGPAYRCKNGDCDLIEPRTVVEETERKTTYRCPECKRILNINWKND